MSDNFMMDMALRYAALGWQVFPLTANDKIPMAGFHWRDEATIREPKIREWWKAYPNANIGIATGPGSNLVVLDVDAAHGGFVTLEQWEYQYEALPDTPRSRTGSGGRHYFFLYPDIALGGSHIKNSAGKLGDGLDIRGDGGYVVAPPSVHPNGTKYEWEADYLPSTTPVGIVPNWMGELLRKVEQDKKGPAQPIPEKITAGNRNPTLTSVAGTMRRRGVSEEAILAALTAENASRCEPPLPAHEIAIIAASVGRYEPKTPLSQLVPPQTVRVASPPVNGGSNGQLRPMTDAGAGIDGLLALLDNLDGRTVQTGIPSLDREIGGLERQTLTVLGGRPGMGKSTLGWQIGRNVSLQSQRVAWFSLEVSTASLWAKAACGSLGIRWKDIRAGLCTPAQIEQVKNEARRMATLFTGRLYLDDGTQTTQTIRTQVERLRPDLVVVDHLRLCKDDGENENKRLGKITEALKDIAKEFNCAVLALAQLNRQLENRDRKEPTLSDLRDSGEIEENADMVIMIHRPDYFEENEGKRKAKPETFLLVRKYRDDIGSQRIPLTFDLAKQWFTDPRDMPGAPDSVYRG